jgi:hypothetical protein
MSTFDLVSEESRDHRTSCMSLNSIADEDFKPNDFSTDADQQQLYDKMSRGGSEHKLND